MPPYMTIDRLVEIGESVLKAAREMGDLEKALDRSSHACYDKVYSEAKIARSNLKESTLQGEQQHFLY
jgi:hypothetical protein